MSQLFEEPRALLKYCKTSLMSENAYFPKWVTFTGSTSFTCKTFLK